MKTCILLVLFMIGFLGCKKGPDAVESPPKLGIAERESAIQFLLKHTGNVGAVDAPAALRSVFRDEAFTDGAGALPAFPGPENSCFRFDPKEGRDGNYAVAYIIVKRLIPLKDFRHAFSTGRVFIKRVDLIRVNGEREFRVNSE